MNLTPREKDKLLIAMAAMVARKRLDISCAPLRSSRIFLTSRYFSTISPSARCCFIVFAYVFMSDIISGDEICSVSSS